MQYVRIATYQQTTGTFDDLCQLIEAPGGIADVYRALPGFVAFAFANLGDGTNTSITVWKSAEAADAATAAARTWVAANIGDMGHLTENRTGRLGVVVGELGAVPA